MESLPFIKMHGAGNDYVFVDGFETGLPEAPRNLVVTICDRHFGVGADGLIMMQPPGDDTYDVEMQMWNADGSSGNMCGNGARCVALWMQLKNRIQRYCRIQTPSRIVTAEVVRMNKSGQAGMVVVDMGTPGISEDGGRCEVLGLQADGHLQEDIQYVPVDLGNLHAVVFTDELTDHRVRRIGRLIQQHEHFPDSVNVEWTQVESESQLRVRVLERGSGETLACGSGACAAVVAAVQNGFCRRGMEIAVSLPGGDLAVNWQHSGTILLTGPAEVSFLGKWPGIAKVS